ncbi:MAG: DsbA family protein [Alphaproteobacteria bacterium]
MSQAFQEHKKELFHVYNVENKYAQTAENANLNIVDFSRFGCDHCMNLHPVLKKAINKDGKIRYMPRLVTFGKVWDETLATAVYAAAEQGKFIEMQEVIYKKWPVKSRKDLLNYANGIGLNIEKLTEDMNDPEIIDRMREDQKYFEAWSFSRTPTILVGETRGLSPAGKTPTVDELLEAFERARE